ncbi:MAG: hypothetical protein WCQ50_02950 [Spirochaetota bacterium]
MKRASILLLAAVAMFGLVSCELITSMFGTKAAATPQYSEWWIKGSFDSWADTPHHFLAIDELNTKKLTFVIDNLYPIDYEFVLVSPGATSATTDDVEVKYSTDDNIAPDTQVTMTGAKNASFTAAKKSYTVTVDITDAAAPKLTLVSGSVAVLALTEAVLASNLKVKGDQFSIGWTETAGTYTAATKTVSWDLTASSLTGTFGFSSLDGFLKGVTFTSPATAGACTTTDTISTTASSNAMIKSIPKKDSVYTVSVLLNAAATTVATKYSVSIALKTVGTTAWVFTAPTDIYFVGQLDGATGMTAWSEADTGRAKVTIASGKAVLTYTSTADGKQAFKYAVAAGSKWDNLVGFSAITAGTTGVTLADDGGNVSFTAVKTKTYVITIDFSGTFTSTGISTASVVQQ